jgi:hypothetical protein
MNKKFELHVLSQIYDFLIEREGFTALNLHFKVMEFFRELHVGDKRILLFWHRIKFQVISVRLLIFIY